MPSMRFLRSAAAGVVTAAALLAPGPVSASAIGTWDSRQVVVGSKAGDGLLGVACPTESLCVAVGSRGTIVTSTDPSGGAGSWRSETVLPGPHVGTSPGTPDRTSPGAFQAVSCPTASMCAAVTYAGDFYASADPAGGASTWHATDLDGDEADVHLKGVSCPTTRLCVAVAAGGSGSLGPGGGVFSVYLRPAASPIATQFRLDSSLDLQAVSCSAPSFCLAVARLGRIAAGSASGSGGAAWRELSAPNGPADLESASCPTAGLCLVGDAAGNVLSSPNPGVAGSWREAGTGPSVPITDISCATPSHCAAVDNNGDVIISDKPTGPTGSWIATNLIPFSGGGAQGLPLNALFGLSCPSVKLCVAVGAGGVIFTGRDPFAAEPEGGNQEKAPRGPRRPRLRILRGDHFRRQASTHGAGSRVTFRLRPFGRAQGFLCRLDRNRFHRCRSPLRIYARLGVHVLRARAIGIGGLRGPVARARFTIKRPTPDR